MYSINIYKKIELANLHKENKILNADIDRVDGTITFYLKGKTETMKLKVFYSFLKAFEDDLIFEDYKKNLKQNRETRKKRNSMYWS